MLGSLLPLFFFLFLAAPQSAASRIGNNATRERRKRTRNIFFKKEANSCVVSGVLFFVPLYLGRE